MSTITQLQVAQGGPKKRRDGRRRNALRHGMRGSQLPAGCRDVRRNINQFRRVTEDRVLAHKGEVDLLDAALINTAFRAERHAQLAQKWLDKEGESMSVADRLACSRESVRASEARDKALERLGLGKPVDDEWIAGRSSDAASGPQG